MLIKRTKPPRGWLSQLKNICIPIYLHLYLFKYLRASHTASSVHPPTLQTACACCIPEVALEKDAPGPQVINKGTKCFSLFCWRKSLGLEHACVLAVARFPHVKGEIVISQIPQCPDDFLTGNFVWETLPGSGFRKSSCELGRCSDQTGHGENFPAGGISKMSF